MLWAAGRRCLDMRCPGRDIETAGFSEERSLVQAADSVVCFEAARGREGAILALANPRVVRSLAGIHLQLQAEMNVVSWCPCLSTYLPSR